MMQLVDEAVSERKNGMIVQYTECLRLTLWFGGTMDSAIQQSTSLLSAADSIGAPSDSPTHGRTDVQCW